MTYRAEPKIVHSPMFRANTWLLVLRMQRQKLWILKNIISYSHSSRRVLIPCPQFHGNSFIRKSTTKVQEFYADETSISEWDKSRLCAPSGKEDAELVIILHCQTRNGALPVGAFWDTTTFTIQNLAAKGYSTDFLYGYDWHWRAEETCIGRGNCSAAKWPQAVKRLHDGLSSSLFVMLPSHFALVGGVCAREHVRKFLDSSSAAQRHSLSVPINPVAGLNVEFDLIFEDKGLSRIITYVYHHLSAVYFENSNGPRSCSVQIEAASNFILWLLGKPHDPIAIQRRTIEGALNGFNAAPISEMRRYVALEKKEQKVLDQAGYLLEFLSWAREYLGGEFDITVQEKR